MSLYQIVKAGYKRFVPKAARNTIYTAMPTSLKILRNKLVRLLEKAAHHDEIYDKEYYTATVDPYMVTSCDMIAESIVNMFFPKSAVDVTLAHDFDRFDMGMAPFILESVKSTLALAQKSKLRVLTASELLNVNQ